MSEPIRALQKHLPGSTCTLERTEKSAVTTAWGVRWNEMQIARDIVQNFYDANRQNLEAVKVTVDGRDVRIFGPAEFDLEHLFYLGSEKTGDDVGQYGEGFKAAAVCLLRDQGVSLISISGQTLVHVRLADEPVVGSGHPLVYDFYRISPAQEGSLMILPSCRPALVRELQHGLDHFFSENNRLLGTQLWKSYGKEDEYALYESKTNDGHVFYRRLRRATIEGLPVVLVIHKQNTRIEKKVAQDRDRKAFENAVLEICFDVFASQCALAEQALVAILERSRHCWERGHGLLAALARKRTRFGNPSKALVSLFARYYASSPKSNSLTQLRHESIEADWKKEGRRVLPGYFTEFGAASAAEAIRQIEAKALSEEKRKERSPTKSEDTALRVLRNVLNHLAPVLAELFATKRVRYSVADTDAILGALKHGSRYGSVDVYLAASVFTGSFAEGLAIFLHEHAHMFGYDGSRGFTDALTDLLAALVEARSQLDDYEREWKKAREAVLEERKSKNSGTEPLGMRLNALDREGLIKLIERFPERAVRRLLE